MRNGARNTARDTLRASVFLLRSLLGQDPWPDLDFTGGALTHTLVVPAGPDGRPGERLLAASRSLYAPRICRDDSREDFRVLLDEHKSTLAAVCLRPLVRPEEVEESAWRSLRLALDRGSDGDFSVTRERVVEETAYRYSFALARGTLTDWKLAHAGWLYVIGFIDRAPAAERRTTMRRALDALDSWEWLPPRGMREESATV